jgi:hypothetical protein
MFASRVSGTYRLARALRGDALLVVETRTQHGLRFLADPHSFVDQQILRTGYFEPEILAALSGELREGDVFWDIGANIRPSASSASSRRR